MFRYSAEKILMSDTDTDVYCREGCFIFSHIVYVFCFVSDQCIV